MENISTENTGEGLIFQYIANIIITLSGMFFYLYSIHYFPPDIVGFFSLLLAISSLFNIIFSLGFPSAVSHFISYSIGKKYQGDIKKIIRIGIILGLILSIISSLFVFSFSNLISEIFFHGEYTFYLKLLSIDIFIIVLNNFLVSILFGIQKFKYISIFQSIGNLISYFSGILIYNFYQNLYIIVIGWIMGNLIITLFSIIFILIYVKKIDDEKSYEYDLMSMIKYSIPIYASSILGYGATYMDRFVVSYFLNLTDFGIYTLAILMVTALGFIQGPISNVLMPKFSKFYGENDFQSIKLYASKAFLYILIITVSLTFILSSLSSWIIIFISKSEYLSARIPFIIISISESVSLAVVVVSSAIQSIRKNNIFVISTIIALITNVSLSFTLIPEYKLIGASIAFSASLILNILIIILYALKLEILKLYYKKIAKTYIAGIITFLIIFLIEKYIEYSVLKLFGLIIIAYLLYIMLIRYLKIIENEDADIINSMVPNKLKFITKILEKLILG